MPLTNMLPHAQEEVNDKEEEDKEEEEEWKEGEFSAWK